MKTILLIIAIAIFGFVAESLLPWYSIAFVAFVLGYLLHTRWDFVGGFLGVVVLWGLKIWIITSGAANDFVARVATIFPTKETWVLVLVTLVIGGLVGGFAATTGGLLKTRRDKSNYYAKRY